MKKEKQQYWMGLEGAEKSLKDYQAKLEAADPYDYKLIDFYEMMIDCCRDHIEGLS